MRIRPPSCTVSGALALLSTALMIAVGWVVGAGASDWAWAALGATVLVIGTSGYLATRGSRLHRALSSAATGFLVAAIHAVVLAHVGPRGTEFGSAAGSSPLPRRYADYLPTTPTWITVAQNPHAVLAVGIVACAITPLITDLIASRRGRKPA